MPKFTEHDIRTLAYKFWQERGCPFNSLPEEDWIKAERILLSKTDEPDDARNPAESSDNAFRTGSRNDYQHEISFGSEANRLRWIDNLQVLGGIDTEILRDFRICYPKSYGYFLISFKTGSVAENRGEIEANCLLLNTEDIASYAKESLFEALNGHINPFAPMHRCGPDFPQYLAGATNPSHAYILIPYRITGAHAEETLWCYGLIYDCSTGLWLNEGWQKMKTGATPGPEDDDRIVWAMFERK